MQQWWDCSTLSFPGSEHWRRSVGSSRRRGVAGPILRAPVPLASAPGHWHFLCANRLYGRLPYAASNDRISVKDFVWSLSLIETPQRQAEIRSSRAAL